MAESFPREGKKEPMEPTPTPPPAPGWTVRGSEMLWGTKNKGDAAAGCPPSTPSAPYTHLKCLMVSGKLTKPFLEIKLLILERLRQLQGVGVPRTSRERAQFSPWSLRSSSQQITS